MSTSSRREAVLEGLLEAKGLAEAIAVGRQAAFGGGAATQILAAIDNAIAYIRKPTRFLPGHRVKIGGEYAHPVYPEVGTVRKVTPVGYVIVDRDRRPGQRDRELMLTPEGAAASLTIVVGDDAFPRHDWAAKAPTGDAYCEYCGVQQTDANEFGPCKVAPRAGTQHTCTICRAVNSIDDTTVAGAVAEAQAVAGIRGYRVIELPPTIAPARRGGTLFHFAMELMPDADPRDVLERDERAAAGGAR